MTLHPMPYSIRAFTGGDIARAQSLTRALTVLRDAATDATTRSQIDDVLQGRLGVRQFFRTAAGRQIVQQGADHVERQWSDLGPEGASALAEEGAAQQDSWRQEYAALPPSEQQDLLAD